MKQSIEAVVLALGVGEKAFDKKKMSCAGEGLLSEENGRHPVKVEVLVMRRVLGVD
jgi:hypothetical protein